MTKVQVDILEQKNLVCEFVVVVVMVVVLLLGIKSRALHTLGKCSTTELKHQIPPAQIS